MNMTCRCVANGRSDMIVPLQSERESEARLTLAYRQVLPHVDCKICLSPTACDAVMVVPIEKVRICTLQDEPIHRRKPLDSAAPRQSGFQMEAVISINTVKKKTLQPNCSG